MHTFQVIDIPEFTDEEVRCVATQKGALLTLGLELSAICNFSCIYCYRRAGKPSSNELSLNEILHVADEAIQLGVRKVGIVGAGEPTLDPRLVPVLSFLRERVAKVSLFTNGTGLTKELSRKLYDLQVKIVIKMNSRIPNTFDYLVGKKGGYNMTLRGLENLMDAGYPSAGRRITVESIISRTNIAEMPNLWRWAREHEFEPFLERLTPMGKANDNKDDLSVSASDLLTLFQTLKSIDETQYGYTWTPQPPWPAQRCTRHFYGCLINNEGNVQPCSGIDISVGNIRERSLYQILASSPVIDDLRNIDSRIEGLCSECELRSHCYGCRGAAYQLTGNYLAADPLCWKSERRD